MIWHCEAKVKEQEAQLEPEQAEELKQSKMNQGFEMMDKVLQFTDNKSATYLASVMPPIKATSAKIKPTNCANRGGR